MTTTLETRKLRAGVTSKAPMESRGIPFVGTEIRSVPDGTGSTKLRLTGRASLTEAPYTQTDSQGTCTETVARGAFARHQLARQTRRSEPCPYQVRIAHPVGGRHRHACRGAHRPEAPRCPDPAICNRQW